MAKDLIDAWIENNTGMHGEPVPYHQRKTKDEDFEDQLNYVQQRKRFVYEAWYLQSEVDKYAEEWMSIGKHEVNNQDELFELIEKLENKYKSCVRTNLVKRNW